MLIQISFGLSVFRFNWFDKGASQYSVFPKFLVHSNSHLNFEFEVQNFDKFELTFEL
jgi:hypothetical protein